MARMHIPYFPGCTKTFQALPVLSFSVQSRCTVMTSYHIHEKNVVIIWGYGGKLSLDKT